LSGCAIGVRVREVIREKALKTSGGPSESPPAASRRRAALTASAGSAANREAASIDKTAIGLVMFSPRLSAIVFVKQVGQVYLVIDTRE